MVKKNTLVVLVGPTGIGKTELSLELAEKCKASIISADSRQIFSGIEIGTAAPTKEQLSRVKHYFVGTLQLTDYCSAAQYADDVLKVLDNLFIKDKSAILTGGSMMYVDAVCNGIDDIPTVDADTRLFMQEHLKEKGEATMLEELRIMDPDYYNIVDLKNIKRVVHALEICYMTGKTFTSYRKNNKADRPFNILKIGLNTDRRILFERINKRVDEMMANGFLEEAKRVYHLRHLNSLNTVGYKELFKYIDGEWTLDEAIEKIKKNTRVYAKKQLTWFNRDTSIIWFSPNQKEEIINLVLKYISEHS